MTPALARRLRAAGIHLAISVAVLLPILFFIRFAWYPGPYFSSDGGLYGSLLITSIHLVLGPALTLMIFNPRKSPGKIKFDLVFIGIVQAGALALGSLVVYSERPAAVVFASGEFHSVPARTVWMQETSVADLKKLGLDSPPLVFSRPPRDRDEFANMMLLALNKGIDIIQQVKTFESLESHIEVLERTQADMDELIEHNFPLQKELRTFLRKRNARREAFLYIPFNGRFGTPLFIIGRDGRLAGALNVAGSLQADGAAP